MTGRRIKTETPDLLFSDFVHTNEWDEFNTLKQLYQSFSEELMQPASFITLLQQRELLESLRKNEISVQHARAKVVADLKEHYQRQRIEMIYYLQELFSFLH